MNFKEFLKEEALNEAQRMSKDLWMNVFRAMDPKGQGMASEFNAASQKLGYTVSGQKDYYKTEAAFKKYKDEGLALRGQAVVSVAGGTPKVTRAPAKPTFTRPAAAKFDQNRFMSTKSMKDVEKFFKANKFTWKDADKFGAKARAAGFTHNGAQGEALWDQVMLQFADLSDMPDDVKNRKVADQARAWKPLRG
ncbi:hypothetical protein NCTGTJJY_CDS0141 [Serratia phage 92A1]|nr:hypothetical protein NCTGTJJY_CDS0141 [Serratia phage 92A1]